MADYYQKTFEYRMEYYTNYLSLIESINILGKEGWELVNVESAPNNYRAFLKKSNDNYFRRL